MSGRWHGVGQGYCVKAGTAFVGGTERLALTPHLSAVTAERW